MWSVSVLIINISAGADIGGKEGSGAAKELKDLRAERLISLRALQLHGGMLKWYFMKGRFGKNEIRIIKQ